MSRFIIDFEVIIDGKPTTGTIGVSSPTTDYYPNRVKNEVEKQYRLKYPDAKAVSSVILNKTEVTTDQYKQASAGFIEIKSDKN